MKKTDVLKLRRADAVLAAAMLLAAAALFIAGFAVKDGGERVVVRKDGAVIADYPLAEDGEYVIRTEYGSNTLHIENGEAYISAADCPGGDCMHMGHIGAGGGSVICLPHRLSVTVEGKEQVDAVAR